MKKVFDDLKFRKELRMKSILGVALTVICAALNMEVMAAAAADADNATYYWRSGVASGDWSDSANWERDPSDPESSFHYPDSTECTVSFQRADASVRVNVDGIYHAKQIKLDNVGIALTFVGSNTNDSRIVANGQFGNSNNACLALEAVAFYCGRFIFSAGETFKLDKAAYFQSSSETTMTQNGIRLELHGGSVYYQDDWCIRMSGKDARIVIDDSTLSFNPYRGNQDLDLAYTASSAGGTNVVEFCGAQPRLLTGFYGVRSGSDAVGCVPEFIFHVPVGGYAEAPIRRVNSNASQMFNGLKKNTVAFSIAADSPVYSERQKLSCQLVDWKEKIATDYVELKTPTKSGTEFFYTYGWENGTTKGLREPESDESPTGLWLQFSNTGMSLRLR